MHRRAWTGQTAVVAVVCALLVIVAGCTTVKSPVQIAVGELASAAATGSQLVRAHADGQLTNTTATVGLQDAVKQTASAMRAVASVPGGSSTQQGRIRDKTLSRSAALIHHLDAAIAAVRAGHDGPVAMLRDDRRALQRLQRQAEAS